MNNFSYREMINIEFTIGDEVKDKSNLNKEDQNKKLVDELKDLAETGGLR